MISEFFLVHSLFPCSLYSSVLKHRQTKGNFMPKLMFLDVNVLWKKHINCYISWPGLSWFSSSSRYSLQARVVDCTIRKDRLIQAVCAETTDHRSALLKRNLSEEVEFELNMHWYIMQSLVKCLFKMFTVCPCVWEPQGKSECNGFFYCLVKD